MDFDNDDIFELGTQTQPQEPQEDENEELGGEDDGEITPPTQPPQVVPPAIAPPTSAPPDSIPEEAEALKKILATYGFQGSTQDILDQSEATAAGCSIEELRARREQTKLAAQEMLKTDPEYMRTQQELGALRAREADRVFAEDMAAVMAVNPNETAKSITELGEDFIRLRAAGISAEVAYNAVNATKKKIAPPPNSGKVSAAGRTNTEFYTPEEVRAMSTEDVLKNLEKVEKSQRQWGV